MFKRRTKKSSDEANIRDVCGSRAETSQAQSTTHSTSVNSTQPKTQSTTISTIDDFEDLDGPTEQRMVRNLTVSRSGRYKSKSKSRPSLAQSSAGSGADGSTNRQTNSSAAGGPGSAVVRSTAASSSAVYGGSIAATAGGPPTTSYRGMATAL